MRGYSDGRAVAITGGGRGLGAAYAWLAAACGASVLVNDVDASLASPVADEIGGVADSSDISTWEGAGALVSRCVEEFGAIDGLVNNAASPIPTAQDPTAQDPADLRAVIEVNLLGTAVRMRSGRCCRGGVARS